MSRRKSPPKPPAPFVETFETFRDPRWVLRDYSDDGPTAFNGDVRVRRYRITVEMLDEPVDVIRDRIRSLYRGETNHHRRASLASAATMYGFDVRSEP